MNRFHESDLNLLTCSSDLRLAGTGVGGTDAGTGLVGRCSGCSAGLAVCSVVSVESPLIRGFWQHSTSAHTGKEGKGGSVHLGSQCCSHVGINLADELAEHIHRSCVVCVHAFNKHTDTYTRALALHSLNHSFSSSC